MIEDREGQYEEEEDAVPARLPGKVADKKTLRQAIDNLASQDRPYRINLTDREAKELHRQGRSIRFHCRPSGISPSVRPFHVYQLTILVCALTMVHSERRYQCLLADTMGLRLWRLGMKPTL